MKKTNNLFIAEVKKKQSILNLKLIGISRGKAIELIKQLVKRNVIRKSKIKTRQNKRVYGDNHYTVVCYGQHKPIKHRFQGKKLGLPPCKSSLIGGQSANLSNTSSVSYNSTKFNLCQAEGLNFFMSFSEKERRKRKYIHNNFITKKLGSQLFWHEMSIKRTRNVNFFKPRGSPQN